jgi:transposase-like protein
MLTLRTTPKPHERSGGRSPTSFAPSCPSAKLAAFPDEAETDVLAYMTFPPYRTKLHSTNPIEHLNGEIKRRTQVVAIFPNESAVVSSSYASGVLPERYPSSASSARSCSSRTMIGRFGVPAT